MKKIIITINKTWNIYNFRLGLIKALQKNGYEVIAIAPEDEYVQKLQNENVQCVDIKINNKGTNPFEDLKLIKDYYKIFKSIRPDAVLAYTIKPNIYASIAASFLKIPMINNISGLGTVFLNDSVSSKIARLMYKIALKNSKKVFFQNQDDLNEFLKRNLVKKEITGLLPGSGVNLNKFSPVIKIRNEKFIFLMIARIIKDKGIIEYLKAAEILKDKYKENIEFQLLGAIWEDNPTAISKQEIEKWHKKGIINYLGKTDDVRKYIKYVDCVVLPSYREGTPRTLLEAAAMAKPLVATKVPGCKEVVEHEFNGFLCKVKDYDDLAEKMEKMFLLDKDQIVQMAKNSRKKVEKEFDEKIVINKYLNELKNL
jgi:glycosyltransferase involved in cell wall biosynthesis